MDGTLRKLIALAADGDMQRRSAALLVLGELGSDEGAVVEVVGAALDAGNTVLRDFALAYAEKVAAPALLPRVVPHLASPDAGARGQAESILAAAGRNGVAAAAAALPKLDRRARAPVAAWLAHQEGKKPLDAMVRVLGSDDGEAVREASRALAAAATAADDAWRTEVASRLTAVFAGPAVRANDAIALALLDLAGVLARPEPRAALADLVRKGRGVVRVAATRALCAAIHTVKMSAVEFRLLLSLLEETDESLVRAAADGLLEQPFGAEHAALLSRLAAGSSPAAKRFALARMAQLDSSAVVKTLVAHLDGDDFAERTAAQTALKQIDGAHPLLSKALLACDDERRAWVLADILGARSDGWRKDQLQALVARFAWSLDRPDRLWSALLHVVRAAGGEARAAAALDEEAETLFKRKKFGDAARRLAMRLDLPEPSDETRFSLALARLKATPRDLTALARRRDEALEILVSLERGSFPLADRLRKARALATEELFYVGFNLAENPATRDASAELLAHVVKKTPRTKVGKAARNKLALLERRAH
jgi:hypothetical protein